MKKNKVISLICLTIAVLLIVICMVGKNLKIFETYKALFGISLGIGSGLFGGSLGHLINTYVLDKYPSLKKSKDIEMNDERNIYINNRAKAKAFNFIVNILPLIMFICTLLEIDFTILIMMVMFYLSIFGIYIYYSNKYSKEM
jgi:VIT1/CCC1 family predicted Fe2+/Mn2+ transporter